MNANGNARISTRFRFFDFASISVIRGQQNSSQAATNSAYRSADKLTGEWCGRRLQSAIKNLKSKMLVFP
jgi:hypothetical protein